MREPRLPVPVPSTTMLSLMHLPESYAWDEPAQVQNAEDRLEMLEQELKMTYLHRQDLAAYFLIKQHVLLQVSR